MAGVFKYQNLSVLLLALCLTACGGNSSHNEIATGGTGGTGGTSGTGGTGGSPSTGAAQIKVLSNRSDLISGHDALVEIIFPAGTDLSTATVTLNGQDIKSAFAQRANGRYMGLVTGMALGSNLLTAVASGVASTTTTIVNHPNGGPVFAGPQLQPWTCRNSGAVDAKCNQPPEYAYFYKSTDQNQSGLQPYDLNNPALDVAMTTTDQGVTVPFIVQVETGYQDRDQYKIAALFQPGQPWTPWAPQPQFNHKMVITHGVSCDVDYQTGNAPSVLSFNPVDLAGAGLPAVGSDSVEFALGQGFVVMSTALNHSGHNCNVALQAESMVMAKERVVEQYGELRYTIGTGCSGGSLAQQWVANAYPGIYQGILPTCSFADAWSTATQFLDYHLTLAYFLDPSKWGSLIAWSPTQMADVQGHLTIVNSQVSDSAQWQVAVPTNACSGISDTVAGNTTTRYDPDTNPGGVRCSIQEAAINIFGKRERYDSKGNDLWSPQEIALGRGFAGVPIDNVGVQYGLSVLQTGTITPAQFVDLNAKIGGVDIDTNPTAARISASQPALANAYKSGMINEANNLNHTAIIDCRGPDPGAFHDSYRAYSMRARLDREHGSHENQLIWEGPAPIIGDADCALNSLKAMDRWLAAVEQDGSQASLASKIVSNKPGDLGDQCYNGVGTKLTDGTCPRFTLPGSPALSIGVVPIYATPRMMAGDAITTDANKCQLKALDRGDYTFVIGGTDTGVTIPFTDAQWAQLQALFPDGVCDFKKPGVSQQATIPWQTYQNAAGGVIFGGISLPASPANSGEGLVSPAFVYKP